MVRCRLISHCVPEQIWSSGILGLTRNYFVRTYEAHRLFRDRLVGDKSQGVFDKILHKALTDNRYPASLRYSCPLQSNVRLSRSSFAAAPDLRGFVYASRGSELSVARQPLLARVSVGDYAQRVADGLKTFEREVRELRLQMFADALLCTFLVSRGVVTLSSAHISLS
jgi:hypothetical protein